MARIEVDSEEFRRSHWREPRGRGSWLFVFDGQPSSGPFFEHSGPFGEARRAAVQHARKKGHRLVRVNALNRAAFRRELLTNVGLELEGQVDAFLSALGAEGREASAEELTDVFHAFLESEEP